MKKQLIFITAIAVIVLSVASICLRVYTKNHVVKTEPLTVACDPLEHMALLWIAQDLSLFTRNGITINLQLYNTGVASLDGMLNNEADIAVGVAEYPVVGRSFLKEKIKIIGNIAKTDYIYIIARKDHGIEKGSDLKGKKVGIASGTILEFYLGRFLNLNGLTMNDISLIDLKDPSTWDNVFTNDDLDAIVSVPPFSITNSAHLGSNAIVWPIQDGQVLYSLIVVRDEWLARHPDLSSRFLKSLAQAEDFFTYHPSESKAILQKHLNLDALDLKKVLTQNQFSLSLDQLLLLTMEDEARWMIKNKLIDAKEVPVFLDYISFDALEKIKPNAVRIIH